MATAGDVLARYKALDVRAEAYRVASRFQDELIETQKSQLWAGKDLRGNDLSPSIYNDPYFEDEARRMGAKNVKETARRLAKQWADYKDRQAQRGHNAEFGIRKHGIANLIFSTGRIVWEPMHVEDSGQDFHIVTDIQDELEQKYGDVFGLNPQGVGYFNREYFREAFFEAIRKAVGV